MFSQQALQTRQNQPGRSIIHDDDGDVHDHILIKAKTRRSKDDLGNEAAFIQLERDDIELSQPSLRSKRMKEINEPQPF